ncbi:MAG TPA: site-specific DNA-methyltransferase [Firmicutes bacterium]|nr:site-specific DNA-methyltransferase [Bacillota bacterium]
MSQKYEKLKTLLKELFQLDQPDLDFGLYRIMHAKDAEVTHFLEQELLPQVKAAFAQYRTADRAEIEKQLEKAIEQAHALGADPETLPKVKELRAKLASEAVDIEALEAEVYDHLYSFFRRYYSEGDFLSKRVYKPGVYAIPYEGEEVKLHWANADQYYIKTSEYFRDYAFRLRPEDEKNPMRVHFRLVDAAEGEHGNVKEQTGKERRFKLAPEPFAAIEDGELVIRFTYEPDPEKRKQKDLNAEAEAAILGLDDPVLADWIQALGAKHVRSDGTVSENTRLRVHLDRYTARNTFDYFIHKDLGGFLRRELDFYIKNEVMHLDDVENETAPRVEQFLSKIKVIRRIAHKIIDFLAQLEDFQKKLWLKKKFVVETSYCIRLGVIPEEFYPEIAANDAQREEWVRLCAIDEIKATEDGLFEPGQPGYSVPLTVEFLKAHPTLVVDTRHFDTGFTARLLHSMEDLDALIDGVLYHSDAFQALLLLQTRFRAMVKCVYIDPPFNTGKDDFPYKDNYQHSSWMSMMSDRAELARELMADDGLFSVQIGDEESARLRALLDDLFAERKNTCVVRRGVKSVQAQFSDIERLAGGHDVIHCYCKRSGVRLRHLRQALDDERPGKWDTFWRGTDRPTMRYELFGQRPETGQWRWEEKRAKRAVANYEYFLANEALRKTLDEWYAENLQCGIDLDFVRMNEQGVVQYYVPPQGFRLVSDNWLDIPASGSITDFAHEKSVALLQRLISWSTEAGDYVLDYFAGSGSTGQAAFAMSETAGGPRKFLLVEMSIYFDELLLPRLKKAIYAPEWKDGKPKRLVTAEEAERSPRIMKVIRLESYEDTLNNLELRRTEAQQSLLDSPQAQGPEGFKEQYMLRYMLDVETRGSQSLLNIAAFMDPTAYKLKVKRPGSDETREVNVDLLETFNWLIGLRVEHIAAPRTFNASFRRDDDPDLPKDAPRRLLLDGRIKEDPEGPWWFRTVTGTTLDGRRTLIIWRKRPGGEDPEGIERDNLVLDEWFRKQGYSSKDSEFDLIYVNGDNNLENLKAPDDTWKVRLIEEDFFRLMFEMEGV